MYYYVCLSTISSYNVKHTAIWNLSLEAAIGHARNAYDCHEQIDNQKDGNECLATAYGKIYHVLEKQQQQ